MSESDDSDILADIKALDNALMLNTNDKVNSSWHDLHDDSSSSSIDESDDSNSDNEFFNQSCQDTKTINAYEVNKKLTKGLMLIKKKVSALLQNCEEKIEELNEEIETNKDGNMLNERAKYSLVGIPYFKDKLGFSAPKNADTKLKGDRGELSLLNVQKSCRWSGKDRTKLLNAIRDEVFNSISVPAFNMEIEQTSGGSTSIQIADETTTGGPSKSSTANSSNERTVAVSINFSDMVRAMGEKQIDWMKIALQHFENRHAPIECQSMWNVYLHPDINKSDWTNQEDKRLMQHAKLCSYQDWNTIATKLDTKRSAYQCFIRYNTIRNLPVNRTWTKQEGEHLQLVISKLQIGNYIPWSEVATYMGNRTKQQVYTRWIYRAAPYLTKGRFNYMETQTLLEAVKRYGTDFGKISRYVMPHRTTVQLNGHYRSLQQAKASAWTYEDDVKLLKLHKKHGNKWVKIAKSFTLRTRTDVRHRYRALQRYANKGYKVATIPRSTQSTSFRSKKIGGSKSSSSASSSLAQKSKFAHQKASSSCCNICKISSDTIQARLFENLNFPLIPTASIGLQEVYDVKELAQVTKELYDTLKLLDVNFDLSNMIFDYAHLSKKERQLFTSLKKYVSAHHYVNDENRDKIIEKFRFRMFGSGTNVTSHFIPPPPFSGYVKRKRPYKTNSINYDLNTSDKFLVDVATDRLIPCNANLFFVDVEEDIQFQKLSQLLISDNYSYNKPTVNSHASLGYNPPLNEIKTRTSLRYKPSTAVKIERCATETIQSCKTQETRAECINKDVEDMDKFIGTITPNHETLLGLKNVIFWKMLYEYEIHNQFHSVSKKNNTQQQCTKTSKSPEYEKAYQTLKTRLMRLFKLPLALSRVMVDTHAQESLFVTDEQKEQSTKKWSEKQVEKNKQAVFANKNISQKTHDTTINCLTTQS